MDGDVFDPAGTLSGGMEFCSKFILIIIKIYMKLHFKITN